MTTKTMPALQSTRSTPTLVHAMRVTTAALLALAISSMVSGCGGGGGDITPTSQGFNDTGGGAVGGGGSLRNDDVRFFALTLWPNLNENCGTCHSEQGGTIPFHADADPERAYDEIEAEGLVNRTTIASSRLVTKVAGGHRCWLSSDADCASAMEGWITEWLTGDSGNGGTKQVSLSSVENPANPETSLSWPATSDIYATTVYPVVEEYCQECHSDSAAVPQNPLFAREDVDAAYDEMRASGKMLLDPTTYRQSRVVVRLSSEFHNCWSDCASDANEMAAAILAFIQAAEAAAEETSLDGVVTSSAMSLYEGVVPEGGSRYEGNMIAMWEFKELVNGEIDDVSNPFEDEDIDLTLTGDVSLMSSWGIDIRDGRAQASVSDSSRLFDEIMRTQEYSIEAWVVPANTSQEMARIVSYSGGSTEKNFSMSQTLYAYDFINRNVATDFAGEPALSTEAELARATQQHVVMTYDRVNGRRIYVDGRFSGDLDSVEAESLTGWDNSFAFVIGSDLGGRNQWEGKVRLAAIYNRALTESQIQQNFEADVGQKFFLMFRLDHLNGLPQDSYIVFEVSQFDDYSYLFSRPFFVVLGEDTAWPDGLVIRGLRLGINGKVPTVGQAYSKLNVTIDSANRESPSNFSPAGQVLSEIGTIIALENGPASDQFFVAFDQIGTNVSTNINDGGAGTQNVAVDTEEMPRLGVRTFAEINATMADITGVDPNTQSVEDTFLTVEQQLPSVENIDGFLAAHQMAVAQLAMQYCDALVANTTLRDSFFPGFNFGASASAAFDTPGERDQIINPLMDKAVGVGLTSQPTIAEVRGRLNTLMDALTACGGTCPAGRTEAVVKGTCASVLGSAAMLIQ